MTEVPLLDGLVREPATRDPPRWVHGPGLFGSIDLPDGLHPDAAGYRRMGERFAPVLGAHLRSGTA